MSDKGNPYDNIDLNSEEERLVPPKPIDGDRGEPTTKAPKKGKGKILALVIVIIVFALAAVFFFFLLFYNAVLKKDASTLNIKEDPALQQKSSTGPSLGAYQDKVAKALEEDKKRKEMEALASRQNQAAAAPAAAAAAAAPPLGRLGPQAGNGGRGREYPREGVKKSEMTPQEIAAQRRWDNDVLWDGKGATGGPGQLSANYSNSGSRVPGSVSGGQNQASFEDRMAANPYLNSSGGTGGSGGGAGSLGGSSSSGGSSIGGMLATESYANGIATMRPDMKFLLRAGQTIPCTLIPRIVTNYPGQTRCLINKDVYSADGSVVLINRGDTANGERKVQMKQGVAKVFITWGTIESDEGASIRIDSMAADQLGAAGVDAWVDRHLGDRFGGAVALSLLDDGLRILSDSAKKGDGVTFDSSTNNTQDMASIALENSINIPPTGHVNPAQEITIIVARDVDFRSIYEVE